MPERIITVRPRRTLLEWIQEKCGHACEVWAEDNEDGSWSLHVRAGCNFCEMFVLKTINQQYPQLPIILAK